VARIFWCLQRTEVIMGLHLISGAPVILSLKLIDGNLVNDCLDYKLIGEPEPIISWLKDGHTLSIHGGTSIRHFPRNSSVTTSDSKSC